MAENIGTRFKRAWNAFMNRAPTNQYWYGNGYSDNPTRTRLSFSVDRNIVSSIYNRIALDVSSISIQHIKTDDDGMFIDTINSGLNNCLNLEANIDQTGRSFIKDVVISMFDEGCVALVPTKGKLTSMSSEVINIETMRTGKITYWYPKHVRVSVYNEIKGIKEEIVLPKKFVGIIENPFYSVMNEPNSILKTLIKKMNYLDTIDSKRTSPKLDLIFQLPYAIKGETKKRQAEERRKSIENQLENSKYGIAYIDATENVVQLNRAVENNLIEEIESLTKKLYSQLGLDESIMNGTADEKSMLNYFNSTIVPILLAIVDELNRKFLSKTARTQNQKITYFRDPFKSVPVLDLAEASDKFTRNEVLSSNEVRAVMGYKPDSDPKSNMLLNKNIRDNNISGLLNNNQVEERTEEINE